jgi:hypothetical protein
LKDSKSEPSAPANKVQDLPQKRKRGANIVENTGLQEKSSMQKKKANGQLCARMCYTVASIMSTWDDTTDYGISFRGMNATEQDAEMKRLNKVAMKAQKDIVKNKVLIDKYKSMVAERMRAYLTASRSSMTSIFHVVSKSKPGVLDKPSFLSVGEWVEVDADRTPGFNSEGGIAVIIGVQDNCADVKYVSFSKIFL